MAAERRLWRVASEGIRPSDRRALTQNAISPGATERTSDIAQARLEKPAEHGKQTTQPQSRLIRSRTIGGRVLNGKPERFTRRNPRRDDRSSACDTLHQVGPPIQVPARPRDVPSSPGSLSAYYSTQFSECLGIPRCPTLQGMGRKLDVEQLVGSAEIAERLGVKRQQVIHDWRRRHSDFPVPVLNVGRAGVWYWPEVREWAERTGRSVPQES